MATVNRAASSRTERTNRLAIASLVCGLILVCGLLFFEIVGFPNGDVTNVLAIGFIILAIAAITLGHRARRAIKRNGGGGRRLATTGLVLGWTPVALFIALLVVALNIRHPIER